MKVAFTICSNNYLAQASVLAESFKKFNSNFYFAIILVDEFSDIVDYKNKYVDELVRVSELDQYSLRELFDKYDIIELNTAVKPFIFKYFIEKFTDLTSVYYFDPDIKFFSDINALDKQVLDSSVVLTPHITSPILLDELGPQESLFLNYGLYNLGFLGLNPKHSDSLQLLDWWGERTFKIGYADVKNGLFVDQLWMNFTPLFYSDVTISFDKGLNMGPWNLHERSVKHIEGNDVILDNDDLLKFYHFSSYNYKKPDSLSKHYSRYSFENIGLLKDLYFQYHVDLLKFNVEKYASINYVHGRRPEPEPLPEPPPTLGKRIKNKIIRMLS